MSDAVFPSRVGAVRRMFATEAEADAHARGWHAWPREPSWPGSSPEMLGWLDAQAEYREREEGRGDCCAAQEHYISPEDAWT